MGVEMSILEDGDEPKKSALFGIAVGLPIWIGTSNVWLGIAAFFAMSGITFLFSALMMIQGFILNEINSLKKDSTEE